jgi:hypothetical protein
MFLFQNQDAIRASMVPAFFCHVMNISKFSDVFRLGRDKDPARILQVPPAIGFLKSSGNP